MEIPSKSAPFSPKSSSRAGPLTGWGVLVAVLVAAVVVLLVARFTNHLNPKWDMLYYQDMAANGLVGNHHLVAPFAYRPAAPLVIGALARAAHEDYADTFRTCAQLMSMVFIVACFVFARLNQCSDRAALFAAVLIALNLYIIKWNVFAGSMVDIYAYPLLLLGFWAVLTRRFHLLMLTSVAGLFVKEFLLLPLVAQAGMLIRDNYRTNRRKMIGPMALMGAILVACFVLPRVLIPVVDSLQDVDPHQLWKLRRLISYPASPKRWFNILFAYVTVWLPVLLLLTRSRWRQVQQRLYPHRWAIFPFLAFQLVLVMYGGTNIVIYVTYSAPVAVLALVTLLDSPDLLRWEPFAALAVVILFNREWMSIPLPQYGLERYLDFIGGYSDLVTWRSFWRFAEAFAYILGFWTVRATTIRRDRSAGRYR
jgi:hypothetical protein